MFRSYKNFLLQLTKELDVVLIGKTGNGKSASGNSILNKKSFKQSFYGESETKYPSYDTCEFRGYRIQVVDCPGIFDTNLNAEDGIELFRIAIQNAVLANPKGYHAFIIVIRFGARATSEEIEAIKLIKIILGKEALEKYGIILMTNGDSFKKETDLTLALYCEKQTGFFKDIISECKNRVVVFDNLTDDEETRINQRQNLLETVLGLNNNNQRYKNEHFKKAKQIFKSENAYHIKDCINMQSFILDMIRQKKFTSAKINPESLKTISEDVQRLKLKGEDEKKIAEPAEHLLANIHEAQEFAVERIEATSYKTNTEHKQEKDDQGTRFQGILQSFQHSKEKFDNAYFPLLEDCVKQSGDQIITVSLDDKKVIF